MQSEYVLENEIRFSRSLKSGRLPALFKRIAYTIGTFVRDPDLSRNTKLAILVRDNGGCRSILYDIKEYFKNIFLTFV